MELCLGQWEGGEVRVGVEPEGSGAEVLPSRCWDLKPSVGLEQGRMESPTGPGRTQSQLFPGRGAAEGARGHVVWDGPSDPCLAQVGNLKAHLKIHIADGPLKCRECGKQFTTSGRARLPRRPAPSTPRPPQSAPRQALCRFPQGT